MNEPLYRIGQWFAENHLEVAEHKCEGVLVTMRRSFEKPIFVINGHEIPVKRGMKYLGLWFDDKWSYKAQVREAALKADRVSSALQRLMPNIGGTKPNRRALLSTVSLSIMLYGAAIWGRIASEAVIDGKLGPVQRRLALRTNRAYCTVSYDAACLLAGTPPICLLVAERGRTWKWQEALKNDGVELNPTRKALIREVEWAEIVENWQKEWGRSTKGRWTSRLIPNIARWIDRPHGELDYRLTQAISGHGCFGEYLERFQKRKTPVCQMCGADWDDAEHALFQCEHTRTEKAELMDWLGAQLTPENLVPTMFRRKETWVKIADFIKTAITRKEERERPLQRQARGAA